MRKTSGKISQSINKWKVKMMMRVLLMKQAVWKKLKRIVKKEFKRSLSP
jgi:hypothetical protein